MKRNIAHIQNKQGSMLMFTLIVFMVILILGTTMVTSMLYSQGENNMQINQQKAYYAAQSAVDAIKSYFLNPTSDFISTDSIASPHDLIGTTGTYTLKAQGIDEDTTVSIKLTNEGPVPNEGSKNYILIEATGNCQGESSTVKARMIEEVQEGGNLGIYGSNVVFGSLIFKASGRSEPLKIIGNMFVDDVGVGSDGINLSYLDFSERNEEGENNTLYINSENSNITIDNSKIEDIFIQYNSSFHINNNQIKNIYMRSLTETNGNGMSFRNNQVEKEAQLFISRMHPNIGNNIIGEKMIIGVTKEEVPSWAIASNEVNEVYIKGAKKLGAITGKSSDKPIKVLYTDATEYENQSYYYLNQIIEKDLSFINAYEERIAHVVQAMEETSNLLKNKPTWTRPDESSSFIKIEPGEGPYAQDPANSQFEEYYDPNRKIRLVFSNYNGYNVIKNKKDPNERGWYTYFISDDPVYAEDEIFFVAENSQGVNFHTSSEDKFDGLYLYAPNAQCSFSNDFEYFKGSIIARNIIINPQVKATFIFKEIEDGSGVGIPGSSGDNGGSTGSIGNSGSGKTYTYYFEEYID